MKAIIIGLFLVIHLTGFCQVPVFPYRDKEFWGAVDGNLKQVIPPLYRKMSFFINHESDDAVAIVTDEHGYSGLVNRRGDVLLKPEYTSLTYTEDESAVVLYRTFPDKKYGLYSIPQNKIVVSPVYDEAPSLLYFNMPSLLVVKQKGKYGVVSTDGTTVIPIQYTQVRLFSRDECPWIAAYNESAVVYYDCKGKIPKEQPQATTETIELIPIGGEQVREEGPLANMSKVTPELAKQKLGEKTTIISHFQNGTGEHFAIVQADNKVGIIDGKGIVRVPVEYDAIKQGSGIGGFLAVKNGFVGWIDIAPGKIVIEPRFRSLYTPYRTFGGVKASYRYVVGVMPYGDEAFIELKTGKVFYPPAK